MKNVYLIQLTEGGSGIWHFPYSVAMLQSYCQTIPKIRENYKFNIIFRIETNFKQFVENLENPFLIGYSSYIWNSKRHLLLAKYVKQQYPKCVNVIGGPSFPNINQEDSELFFNKNPYMDAGVSGEGEKAFSSILLKLLNGEKLDRHIRAERIDDLNVIPSPYDDIFQELKSKNKDIEFECTIETDRGCPFKCTFCDWGSLTQQKIKQFDIDRVFFELKKMSENKIPKLQLASSNLGIFKKRDFEIVDYLCSLHEDTGYPQRLTESGISKTPNNKNSNVQIRKRLKTAFKEYYHSPRIFLQSSNEEVLKNIRRVDTYKNDLELFKDENYQTVLELLFPMPGHNYDIFTTDATSHMTDEQFVTHVMPVIMLPNAPMNDKFYREKYNIKTIPVPWGEWMADYPQMNEVIETVELLISFNDLSFDDTKKCWMFLWIINSFYTLKRIKTFSLSMSEYGLSEENSIQIDLSNIFFEKTNQLVTDTEYTHKDIFVKFQDFLETDFNAISHMYDNLKELLYTEDVGTFKKCNRPYLFYDQKFYKKYEKDFKETIKRFFHAL